MSIIPNVIRAHHFSPLCPLPRITFGYIVPRYQSSLAVPSASKSFERVLCCFARNKLLVYVVDIVVYFPCHLSTLYTLPPPSTFKFKSQNDANNALFHIKTCIYQQKAVLLHQNILSQLWNINLVLAVVLRFYVSTRIPLSANVQVWNSLLLRVLI